MYFGTFEFFAWSESCFCSSFGFAKCVEVVFPTCCDYKLWKCCNIVYFIYLFSLRGNGLIVFHLFLNGYLSLSTNRFEVFKSVMISIKYPKTPMNSLSGPNTHLLRIIPLDFIHVLCGNILFVSRSIFCVAMSFVVIIILVVVLGDKLNIIITWIC
jgi:hypothetical protein